MPANPEAIAWYLERSERLLGELRDEVQSLRTRAGQLAGFSGAVLALIGANSESVLGSLGGPARACGGALLLIGSLLLVASLIAALRGTLLPRLLSGGTAREVANYSSERFTFEPELWRVHVRAIHGSVRSIESMTRQIDAALKFVRIAEYLFFAGLFTVGSAFASLIVVTSF